MRPMTAMMFELLEQGCGTVMNFKARVTRMGWKG